MGQPRIVEVDYYTFRVKLKAAAAAGNRIEKTDGERWKEYVKTRKVDLYTINAWAKVRFMGEEIKVAVIDGGGDWDGVYTWCEEDERVARWESGEESAESVTDQGSGEESAAGQEPAESVGSQEPGESAASQNPEDGVPGQDPEKEVT